MTAVLALAVFGAGLGVAAWASKVEQGPPGWRSALATGLVVTGAAAWIVAVLP